MCTYLPTKTTVCKENSDCVLWRVSEQHKIQVVVHCKVGGTHGGLLHCVEDYKYGYLQLI